MCRAKVPGATFKPSPTWRLAVAANAPPDLRYSNDSPTRDADSRRIGTGICDSEVRKKSRNPHPCKNESCKDAAVWKLRFQTVVVNSRVARRPQEKWPLALVALVDVVLRPKIRELVHGGSYRREVLRLRVPALRAKSKPRDTPLRMTTVWEG